MKKKKQQPAKTIVPDFDLWLRVARSVAPIDEAETAKNESNGNLETETRKLKTKATPVQMPVRSAHVPPRQQTKSQPAMTGIDRRERQKLSRGNANVEARIDLHGETVEMARYKLLNFLSDSVDAGRRLVLVITGKGASRYSHHTLHGMDYYHSTDRSGKIRQAFPHWLQDPAFHALVSGFQPAHPKHGGGGAFYVRLRRKSPKAGWS